MDPNRTVPTARPEAESRPPAATLGSQTRVPGTVPNLLAICLLAAACLVLYAPYLGNRPVFDDQSILGTPTLTASAIAPWEVGIRGLPYFTIGWVQTQIGTVTAHRSVSLILHILVAWLLYRFLTEFLLLRTPAAYEPEKRSRVYAASLAVALAFALHPVAVYGAGYLVQRTIVFATLFSLLCLRSLLVAVDRDDRSSALLAALWATLAVFSKEHAAPLPFAALGLALAIRPRGRGVRLYALFLGMSLPAVLFAVISRARLAGTAYEPLLQELDYEIHAVPKFEGPFGQWLFSASTQVRLYFEYWHAWLMPDLSKLSADIRIDFLQSWSVASGLTTLVGGLIAVLTCCIAAFRRPALGALGFTAWFTATMFAIELSSVRFQEPFVLYRSYLWVPGYAVLVATVATTLRSYVVVALSLPVLAGLTYQATDRLDSFRTPLTLWEDAANKLPKAAIAGSTRIYFNRGGERYRAGRLDEAWEDISLAIQLAPGNPKLYQARGGLLLARDEPGKALADFNHALELKPNEAHFIYSRGLAEDALGKADDALRSFREAARLGNFGAKYRLASLNSNGESVVVDLRN